MVTRICFVLSLILMASCTGQPKPPNGDSDFDTQKFQIGSFTGRVQEFLKSRPETKGYSDYKALFVNTENCSACIQGAFEAISPFLAKVQTKTFVYLNDSSLIQIAPENDHLQFICLPAEDFQLKKIFHRELYLYTAHGDQLKGIYLSLDKTDSLNKLP